MHFFENFNISFSSLRANKTRAFLTMLGIIIGVMMIILLVSVITGTKTKIESDIMSLGSNVFMVFPGNYDVSKGPPTTYVINKLRLRHVDMLSARSSYNALVCSEYDVMGVIAKYKRESRTISFVIGTDSNMLDVYNWSINYGSFFKEKDVQSARKIVVVGETVVKDLFLGTNPLNKDITIKGNTFRVIGVLKKYGEMFGMDMDDCIIMPITTAHNLIGGKEIHQITLKVPNPDDIDRAIVETRRLLEMEMDKKNFTVASQGEMLSLFRIFSNVLSIVTGCIAGISLLVGGIGIMNIMFVTITERTREIGIRKAVGANFYNILSQFIVESTIISVVGGIFGILFSILIISIISGFVPFPLKASLTSILIAFGFSTLVGVFFGTYPAVKAARIDPIIALKYE